MNAYNFSKINNRDKRFYSFADIAVSKSGIPTKMITIVAVLVFISLLINIPIGVNTNNWYFAPLNDEGINTTGVMLVYGIPIGIGVSLYYIKVFNYRLIDLIYLYIKPKHEINISGGKTIHEKISINAFLERN